MLTVPRRRIFLPKGIFRNLINFAIKNELIEGKYIREFEDKFATYIGVRYAISISSGTAALSLILESLPLKRGDEIILPAYTFLSVPTCIKEMGFMPHFVDIDYHTDNIDISELKKAINHKTRLIIATHLFGRPCDIEAIIQIAKKNKLFIIEDCAHAIGSEYKGRKVGTFGDVAFFSFSLTKPFNTFNGGMIVGNNLELMNKIRQKIEGIPNLPQRFLLRNMCIGYILYFLSKPGIFTFTIYPILLLLSFADKDIVNTYNRIFKKLIFFETKRFKLSNLQAFIGTKILQFYDQLSFEKVNKIMLFNELCKNENINIFEQQDRRAYGKIFHYFFIIKHPMKDIISKHLLWRGIDSGKHLMSNCGELFNGTNVYLNTRAATRNSLQIPIEYCNQRKIYSIIKVIKKYMAI